MSAVITLFPSSQRYITTPVSTMIKTPSVQIRAVLIVAIMDSPDWRAGVPLLETEINRQTVASFSGTISGPAISTVYWMGVIGPHWRYGVKEENERDARPLTAWHDTAHDQASYDAFQHLTTLVAKMGYGRPRHIHNDLHYRFFSSCEQR
ncbi:hypothetical protein EI94DRAFT_797818 [Lactarius quietus]|nr:hypothetical protein EI94DRAFT_797818 [Lactarius quietus]